MNVDLIGVRLNNEPSTWLIIQQLIISITIWLIWYAESPKPAWQYLAARIGRVEVFALSRIDLIQKAMIAVFWGLLLGRVGYVAAA